MQPGRWENQFSGILSYTGRNKASRLMKICFTVWLLSIAVGCSVNNSAKMGSHNGTTAAHNQNSNAPDENGSAGAENLKTTVVKNKNSKTLYCNDPNGYSLVLVPDPDRDPKKTVTDPTILNVVAGDEIKAAIKIPTDSDAQNFSLISTEKTKEGFEITIEYGVRYYYKKQFNFICKEGNFYLYKVKVESFDDADPKSRDNWDRKEIKIKPNLPIEKFSMFDYLVD